MLVKTDIPNLLLAGIKKDFMKQLKMHTPDWTKVATKIPSTKSTEPYAWLGAVPDLKEWKDERIPEGLLENDFSIKNYNWEGTIGVDRDAFDDEFSLSLNSVNLGKPFLKRAILSQAFL